MSKDRDRQGPGNVGAGNKGASAGASKGASAGASKGASAPAAKTKDKSAAAAPAKGGLGGFTSFRDMFDGGGPGKSRPSGPTAPDSSPRARARPDVVKTGTGADARFRDIRTGQSYAAPEYGAFSFRGLTSNDPANVARNRAGVAQMNAMRAGMGDRGGDRSGIASLQPAAPEPVAPMDPAAPTGTAPATPPVNLAQIGAPTTPMAPIFVDSPVYGMGGQNPAINYGTAFMGGPQMTPMNFLDIFAAYPNLGMR
jgi:hypothetical protein